MADMEQGGDAAGPAPQSRTRVLKGEIDGITEVMKVNIEKMIQREEGLDKLSDKAREMTDEAQRFKHTSRNVTRTYWWKNVKLIVVIVVIVLIVILIIILLATGVIPTQATPKP